MRDYVQHSCLKIFFAFIIIQLMILKTLSSSSKFMFLISLEAVMMLTFFMLSCHLNSPIITLVTFLVLMVFEGVVGLSILESSIKKTVSSFF